MRMHQQVLIILLDAPLAVDFHLTHEPAGSPMREAHLIHTESTEDPSRETCSTEAYRDSTESEATPKDLARQAQGFAAEETTIVFSFATVAVAAAAIARKH